MNVIAMPGAKGGKAKITDSIKLKFRIRTADVKSIGELLVIKDDNNVHPEDLLDAERSIICKNSILWDDAIAAWK